ncbi:MAG TPA: hypothetical protein DCP91_11920 [Eggerthellaceae bacterium]|nr:hypothetical protein [Eggerthellaceae bacterium]
MGENISVYLSDAALKKLDAAVAREAAGDRAKGLSGRKVASRSSVVQRLIEDGLKDAPLDRATIAYHVISLAEQYGAGKVSLFGSHARGEATADSDVDILLEKGAIHGLQVLDFQEELSARLGCAVDVVTTAGASERFLGRIRRDEVVLYAAVGT